MNSFNDRPDTSLSSLRDILGMARRQQSLGGLYAQFFTLTKRIVPFGRCGIYLLNDEDEFQLHDSDPPDDRGFAWVDQLIEDGIVDWIIQEGTIRPIPDPKGAHGKEVRLIIPLIVGGRGLGFAALERPAGNSVPPPEKLELLSDLGSVVGLSLESQILTNKVDERRHRLDVLERIGQKLLLITDLNQLLAFILDYALEVVPSQEGSLVCSQDGGGPVIIRRHEGATGRPANSLTRIEKWVMETGNPLMLNDDIHDVRFREDVENSPFPLREAIATPIPAKDGSPGVLTLSNRKDRAGYNNQDFVFLSTLAGHAAVAIEISRLYRNIKQGYKETIRALVNAIEAKDPHTRGHTERVTEYALHLADGLGIDSDQREVLEYASLLHDVGKIGIRGQILRKRGPLTDAEYQQVKKHPLIGESIVKDVRFLERARTLLRSHHERYDGGGYPDRRHGESLPLSAHILILADALDAMSSDRPYRDALTQEEIRKELLRNAGMQFHPRVVAEAIALFFEDPQTK